MTWLLVDPFSGAAGDMFLGALLDLGADLEAVRAGLRTLGVGGFRLDAERVTRAGLAATKARVRLDLLGGGEEGLRGHAAHAHRHGHGHEAGHAHGQEHGHEHGHAQGQEHAHDHPHAGGHGHDEEHRHDHGHGPAPAPHEDHGRHPGEILDLIDRSGLPPAVKALASRAFRLLAEAEAGVHGTTVDQVHFHEVGALDAIVDICGTALALHLLGVERVFSTAVATGSGTIRCAHGTLPIPGPATLRLIEGMPVRAAGVEAELLTPTGAALLRALDPVFAPPGEHRPLRAGYGAGSDDRPGLPNVLRLTLAEALPGPGVAPVPAAVAEIRFEVDDMTPEALGHLRSRLPADLVLDLSIAPCQMKKDRPGQRVTILAPESAVATLEPLIFRHTTTFGFRIARVERRVLDREVRTVLTPLGPCRVKVGFHAGEIVQWHPEPDDVAALALASGRSFADVARLVREGSGTGPAG